MADKLRYPNQSAMTAELFREGDVVSPTYGNLRGVRGVVAHVGPYITIEFPRPVKKYTGETSRPKRMWGYNPHNVRLEGWPGAGPSDKESEKNS